MSKQSAGSLLGGIFLVSGTAIGAGMLALPVLTGLSGFIPSLVLYLLCWLFMAATGLLLLEACLWSSKEINIPSLARQILGPWGQYISTAIYLFFFYCLTLAYIIGCGELLALFCAPLFSGQTGAWLFVLLFAPFVFWGTRAVAPINIAMMVGLIGSFLIFVILGASQVQSGLLLRHDWSQTLVALPIAFAAFGYQGIIPTLVTYLKRDVQRLRCAIIVGSFLPLLAYGLWNWLILGIVPVEGEGGLQSAVSAGHNAVYPLKNILNAHFLYIVGQCFAFFALVTSFFGVTLGLMDFLADGLQVEKRAKMRLALMGLIFLPPLLIASYYPGLFLQALSYAGGVGSLLLLGLLPIAIVWRGRQLPLAQGAGYRFWAEKPLLAFLALFALLELASEIWHLLA